MIGASLTDIVRAATDERAQRVASTAAQAYVPKEYQQVTEAARRAVATYHAARAAATAPARPVARPMPFPLPMPLAPQPMPVNRQSQILTFAAIGGAALLVFLILRR